MHLNMSQFKKVSEDHHSATLEHPSGHRIVLSKKAMDPKTRRELGSLEMHYAEGGEVQTQRQEMPAQTQPTIVINNGAQPNQSPAPQAPNYFTNGTFDFNKFALQNPQSPVDAKMRAVEQMDQQKRLEAEAKAAELAKAQAEAQKIAQYNQMAAERGLPQIPVGNAPINPTTQPMLAQANTPGISEETMPGPSDIPAGYDGSRFPRVPMSGGIEPQTKPQGQFDPYGTQAYLDAYGKGLEGAKQGLQEQASVEGQVGQAQAQVLQDSVQQQRQQMQSAQEHYQALDQERKAIQSDMQNGHIDPRRYVNNMSTGQKIRTAIGLILGGAAGGALHQENPVAKYLNAQINADIESQKADMQNKQTILNANINQFKNLKDATDMTRVMLQDMVSNQIKMEAAKSQDPLAQARAKQAIGQLDMQSAQILSQMAVRKSLLGGMQAGKLDPSMTIRAIVPEGQQQAAYKELGEAQSMNRFRESLLSGFDQVDKINTLKNLVTSPIQTGRQTDAIINPLIAKLSKESAGRFTEADASFIRSLFPSKGDNKETVLKKRAQLEQFVTDAMHYPMLDSYGIKPMNNSRYAPGGKPRLQMGPPVADTGN